MIYEVNRNTELMKNESLFMRKTQGQVPVIHWSQQFVSLSVYNLAWCALLFKDSLFNILLIH